MKYFFSILFIGIVNILNAQISSLYADNLNAFSYKTLPLHTIEFEPNFSFSNSAAVWGQDGTQLEKVNHDLSSSLCWRVTYGFAKNFEIGGMFNSDFSNSQLDIKAFLYDAGILKISAMGGVNVPLGNRTYNPDNLSLDEKSKFAAGIIGSISHNESYSIDINFQYQDLFEDLPDFNYQAYFINAEFGSYFLHDKIRTIVGFGYQNIINSSDNPLSLLSLYPGFAFEFNDRMVFALNSSHDVMGKNSDKSFGMNLACTMLFE